MPKIRLEDALTTEEDWDNYYRKTDITYFEKFCGSCDHFNNEEECPFYGKVLADTKWEKQKCDNFWD